MESKGKIPGFIPGGVKNFWVVCFNILSYIIKYIGIDLEAGMILKQIYLDICFSARDPFHYLHIIYSIDFVGIGKLGILTAHKINRIFNIKRG